jgi:polyhydroxyalkanoate synthase subunit PhaC
LQDLERGQGQLKISMSDTKAFELGKNLATTAGKIIYQNELMQLIHYTPQTATQHAAPLLVIPPWINKYYILDMQEQNSFVRYCLQQGHAVFLISWVNPTAALAHKDFAAYMREGPLAALQQIQQCTGATAVNMVGYCIGGTLQACLLAYLAAQPAIAATLPQITSATYLVTMVDFSEPGDLGVFMDEAQIQVLESQMAEQGYLQAGSMAQSFTMLRANDLIWSFVVNNYLLGREPFPFDLLYWNEDGTNMPAAMHSFYLRTMYLENKLVQPQGVGIDSMPQGVVIDGVSLDLRRITTPSFLLSTREDHIAPWASTYAATQIYGGKTTFMLCGSGHIAGVINPPTANKYEYWTNDELPPNPQTWLDNATRHSGSWWPAWQNWLADYQGADVPAYQPTVWLDDAPGSYVRVRAK